LFVASFRGHLRVVCKNELADLSELVVNFQEQSGHLYQRRQMLVLATQRSHSLGVLHRSGIGKLLLDLAGARKRIGEAIT